jgi:Toprim domain/CHC2 zinc finger
VGRLFTPTEIETARSIDCADEVARRGSKLRKSGRELVGACLACGTGTDRFAINVRENVWHCRGCETGGGIIELVQHLDGVGFRQAVEALIGSSGQATPIAKAIPRDIPLPLVAPNDEPRIRNASKWWVEGEPIKGSIAGRYLRQGRGIAGLPPDVYDVLRFHPRCIFGQDESGRPIYHPCLIAQFRDVITNEFRGIHRTALTPNGRKIDRKALGVKKGAAIKLWGDAEMTYGLVVGEGLETVLTAAMGIEHEGTLMRPAWALIDAGNLRDLPIIDCVEHLTILADNDAPDQRGRRAGQEAAEVCAERWAVSGRTVDVLTPNVTGEDFNDLSRRKRGAS